MFNNVLLWFVKSRAPLPVKFTAEDETEQFRGLFTEFGEKTGGRAVYHCITAFSAIFSTFICIQLKQVSPAQSNWISSFQIDLKICKSMIIMMMSIEEMKKDELVHWSIRQTLLRKLLFWVSNPKTTSNDFKMTLELLKKYYVDPKFVLWDDILNKWTKYEGNWSEKMADILIMPESVCKFQLFLLLAPKLSKTLK